MEIEPKDFLKKANESKDVILLISFGLIMGLLGLKEWTREDSRQEVVLEQDTNGDGVYSDVVIDVSGAVEVPGVYRLPVGSRVGNAIEAAGGLRLDADQDYVATQINLASEIKDGAKIFIPLKGASSEVLSATSNLVSVNKASLEDLKTLKGIGDARAQSVIDNRPYQSLDELISKAGLTQKILQDNEDLIGL